MKIYNFKEKDNFVPRVSIILIDWSCRESCHILDYLSNQTIPRDRYEVIWVEYYRRQFSKIEAGLERCKREQRAPFLDKWIILEIESNVYYHKHLMYNVGIIASQGEIVVICDSDAMVPPTFVETVIKSFEEDPNIVLYIDEVRNFNKKFYPFNYPSIEEVIGEGAVNFKEGTTTGVLDKTNPLHTRNYGGCLCAWRQDVIDIGGADEHIDYLGYICGPYDIGFRLLNIGREEIWHQKELLYHVWHPGSVGYNDYMGPHDGYNMSAPALEALRTGRVMPLLENPIIKKLRRLKRNYPADNQRLLPRALEKARIKSWVISENMRLIHSGRTAFYKGNYDEALECWQKVLKGLPSEKGFYSELGWAYYYKTNYKEALKVFKEALRFDEKNYRALNGIGWTYFQLSNFPEAIIYFNKILSYADRTMNTQILEETYRVLGWCYMHIRNLEDAIRCFDKVLKEKYSEHKAVLQDVFRGLGWCYFHKGDFDTAIRNFNLAHENIDPSQEVLLQEVARALDLSYQNKKETVR